MCVWGIKENTYNTYKVSSEDIQGTNVVYYYYSHSPTQTFWSEIITALEFY